MIAWKSALESLQRVPTYGNRQAQKQVWYVKSDKKLLASCWIESNRPKFEWIIFMSWYWLCRILYNPATAWFWLACDKDVILFYSWLVFTVLCTSLSCSYCCIDRYFFLKMKIVFKYGLCDKLSKDTSFYFQANHIIQNQIMYSHVCLCVFF